MESNINTKYHETKQNSLMNRTLCERNNITRVLKKK